MYKHKDLYILDFSKYKTAADMHEDFKQVFDFPDYYGNNWDAFWDCISGFANVKTNIEIRGFKTFEKLRPKDAKIFRECMNDLKNFANGRYSHLITIRFVHKKDGTHFYKSVSRPFYEIIWLNKHIHSQVRTAL